MKIVATEIDILDQLYPLIEEKKLFEYAKLFKIELLAALHNQKSSLPTILNPIHKMRAKPGLGIAVSIGGTNGYVSLFWASDKGVINFVNRKIFPIPSNTSKEELFNL